MPLSHLDTHANLLTVPIFQIIDSSERRKMSEILKATEQKELC